MPKQSIFEELFLNKKIPKKCPVREQVPEGQQGYEVPKVLRPGLVTWQKLVAAIPAAQKASCGPKNDMAWYNAISYADGVKHILHQHIRKHGKHSENDIVTFHAGWKYTVNRNNI